MSPGGFSRASRVAYAGAEAKRSRALAACAGAASPSSAIASGRTTPRRASRRTRARGPSPSTPCGARAARRTRAGRTQGEAVTFLRAGSALVLQFAVVLHGNRREVLLHSRRDARRRRRRGVHHVRAPPAEA